MIDRSRIDSLDPCVLAVWLAIQVGVIGVCDAGWRLTARWPVDAPAAALELLAIAQVVGLFMLFPCLLANAWTIAITLAASAPMTAVATKLAGQSLQTSLPGMATLALWCVALHPWAKLAANRNAQALAAGIGVLAGVGIPSLAYLAAEFSANSARVYPIIHIWPAHPSNRLHFPPPYLFLSILAGIGLIGAVAGRIAGARASRPESQSTSYPQSDCG